MKINNFKQVDMKKVLMATYNVVTMVLVALYLGGFYTLLKSISSMTEDKADPLVWAVDDVRKVHKSMIIAGFIYALVNVGVLALTLWGLIAIFK